MKNETSRIPGEMVPPVRAPYETPVCQVCRFATESVLFISGTNNPLGPKGNDTPNDDEGWD